ncbi:hypothetical protein [Salmonirosea aquatica]|uniref:Uncharacterized protein n=1 Tax=Salmonirosea aquatica TaxID=2654236 RepID=A0A7C9FFD8_9BACT|nr:hypothetical protein [Cytophagaceae bacterium SJW1-29]
MKNSRYPIFIEFPDVASPVRRQLADSLKHQFKSHFVGLASDGKIWFSFDSPHQLREFRDSTHLAYRLTLGMHTHDVSIPASSVTFSRQGSRYNVKCRK